MSHPKGLRIATEVDLHDAGNSSYPYQSWLIRLVVALLLVLSLQVFLTFLQGSGPRQSSEKQPSSENKPAIPVGLQ